MTTQRPFRKIRHIHMIGIGGAGMSGIAEVLLNLGFSVSGSDLQTTDVTERLRKLGAQITEEHQAENVQQADVVVYSAAVRPENAELRAARDLHIPVIPRSEMLAELMRLKFGIGVSGTHGKTTTTSMVGAILQHANLNPTLIVGGIVRALHTGAKVGSGDLLVVEADEFDRSFLKLTPTIAVITTIEPEHLDTYTDLAGVQDAFVEFAGRVPFYGTVIVCGDEPHIQEILPRIKRPVVSYGLTADCDLRVSDIRYSGNQSSFRVYRHTSGDIAIQLQVPGQHNVLNAAAAIAVSLELDIPPESIQTGLAEFTGVHRRFEIKGEYNGAIIVDDYAHHPTEVENALKTARVCWPQRRIVALFQPHLFTRTRDFAAEFARVLSIADLTLLADIYPSRERPLPGVTSDLISKQMDNTRVRRMEGEDISPQVRRELHPEDVLIVMGAGSITRIANELSRA
jgi:UDP-N-acetylmuramate--alanine ligase